MKRVFLILILLFGASLTNAFSATKTWDGGGANANWTTAANWVNDVAPVANDDLVFPATAAQQTNNNNLFFLTSFRSITIEGGTYSIGGNPLRLTNGLIVSGGTQAINTAITLAAAQSFTGAAGTTTTIAVLSVATYSLLLTGDGNFGLGLISSTNSTASITKNGAGAALIAAASGYSGFVSVHGGITIIDANMPLSTVFVNTPTTNGLNLSGLGGTGTIGFTSIDSGNISAGTLSSPTGILNIQLGGLTLHPSGNYLCKIAGTTPGANGYDQLNVTGAVYLNNARLTVLPFGTFRPAIGDTFVILKNDGTDAITGTFLNAPEGAVFGGALNTAFQITYRGGDGNDVAITRVNRAAFDFDGDGKSDTSIFRPSNGIWSEQLSSSSTAATQQFGFGSDQITPADYDGDNRTDIAVFRPSTGVWYILRSSDNTVYGVQFGTTGDIPVPNDYDGDGLADIAVFRPSNGTWYEMRSVGNQQFGQAFGQNGDVPLIGDFDGDGIGDLAVFRNGSWYYSESSTGSLRGLQFGFGTDKPVPADYDGDGKTDVAVVRADASLNQSYFYVLRSSDSAFNAATFGFATDVPAVADYDGDGKADVAVFRPSSGTWYMLRTTAGFGAISFGQNGDKPIPSAYVP